MDYAGFSVPYYNIPSNNRELQLHGRTETTDRYYNIPSNNRELQHPDDGERISTIITYQVITGNYNRRTERICHVKIITYQVITGNYNMIAPHTKANKL